MGINTLHQEYIYYLIDFKKIKIDFEIFGSLLAVI